MAKIIGRECRFSFHVPKTDTNKDTHVIKEVLHYDNGTTKKNLRVVEDFQRPFWVTKEHYRNHKDKKESEAIDKLYVGYCTESSIATNVAYKLGSMYNGVTNLRKIRMSPYVYGIDINSRTYINHMYAEKYPDTVTPCEVCVLDIEADIGSGAITIISIATNEKIYTVINKEYLMNKITTKTTSSSIEKEVVPKLEYLYKKYVPETDISKNIVRSYSVADNELEAIKLIFATLHKWQPDFVAVWNISYDVNKILDVLYAYGVNPKSLFCDPDLPENIKRFKYIESPKQKVTASGKFTPINVEMQWHTVNATASFYWLDAMSTHRYIRVGGKTMPGGYSLDNILKHDLGEALGKLYFKDSKTRDIKGIDWHIYMSKNRPLEYITYNQWDVISVLELDKKSGDMSMVLPMLAGVSNIDVFSRGPKRIVDAMHFFYLTHKQVLCVKSPISEDKSYLGLDKWIVLLPSCRITESGVQVVSGCSTATNVRMYTYDADQVSGYPSNGAAANVSTGTTLKEIMSIEDMEVSDFRAANMNLLFGEVNSLGFGSKMLGLPTPMEICKLLENMKEKKK